ncbi:MAG: hypothetical protein AB4911_25010 [Oscillochloridaceae bacterium umkhey_bin13]
MSTLRIFRTLSLLDSVNMLADPLLRWLLLVPIMVALAVRGLLPLVLVQLERLTETSLVWLFEPVAGYAVVGIAPLIVGAVVGFLLLDQRDERTLPALRVTPLLLAGYLAYRLAVPTLMAVLATLIAIGVAGGLRLDPGGAILATLAAAPLAPTTALALSALARNKLVGMALFKATSVLLAAPLASLFLAPGWALALSPLPTFWLAQTVWALQAGQPALALIGATWASSGLLMGLLAWRLQHSLH